MAIWKRFLQRKRLMKEASAQLLTPLVLKRAKSLGSQDKYFFELWCKTKKTEFLPEGVPFKITDHSGVRYLGATVVIGLNKPFILVSGLLNKAERVDAARHELKEWSSRKHGENPTGTAHKAAAKAANPRLRTSAREKGKKYFDKLAKGKMVNRWREPK